MTLVLKVAIPEIYPNLSYYEKFCYVFRYSQYTFTHIYTCMHTQTFSKQDFQKENVLRGLQDTDCRSVSVNKKW